jgi:hypothetical protein
MEKIRIRDEKKLDSGTGINIPDKQHCMENQSFGDKQRTYVSEVLLSAVFKQTQTMPIAPVNAPPWRIFSGS